MEDVTGELRLPQKTNRRPFATSSSALWHKPFSDWSTHGAVLPSCERITTCQAIFTLERSNWIGGCRPASTAMTGSQKPSLKESRAGKRLGHQEACHAESQQQVQLFIFGASSPSTLPARFVGKESETVNCTEWWAWRKPLPSCFPQSPGRVTLAGSEGALLTWS